MDSKWECGSAFGSLAASPDEIHGGGDLVQAICFGRREGLCVVEAKNMWRWMG